MHIKGFGSISNFTRYSGTFITTRAMHNSTAKHRSWPRPAELSSFLQTFLPPNEKDVRWFYHTPGRPDDFDVTRLGAPVRHFILGVVPSEQLYSAVEATAEAWKPRFAPPNASTRDNEAPRKMAKGTVSFLHRPFDLDHRRVTRGALVIANHKSLDEYLTTGYNVALSRNLGIVDSEDRVVIQGYKGDDNRRIGLIGRLQQEVGLVDFINKVRSEFGGAGDVYLGDQRPSDERADEHVSIPTVHVQDRPIKVVALMNAFNKDEVQRIVDMSIGNRLIADADQASSIVCLTGAPREIGLREARRFNMPVICVGHRPCEEWGIRFLADRVRQRWPDVDVQLCLDDDEIKEESKERTKPAARAANSNISRRRPNVEASKTPKNNLPPQQINYASVAGS